MSTSQKVVVAVLALVVALFVVAVVVQPGSGEGNAAQASTGDGPGGFLKNLGGDLGTVRRDELAAACLEGDILTFQGSCDLRVAPSEDPMRMLRLLPSRGIEIESRVPTKDFTVEGDAKPNEEVTIAVDERGGAIELTCPGLTVVCAVRLVAGE